MDVKVINLTAAAIAVVDQWRNDELTNTDGDITEESYDLLEALEDAIGDIEDVDDGPVIEEAE